MRAPAALWVGTVVALAVTSLLTRDAAETVPYVAWLLAYATLGGLLALRVRDNPIGWMFLWLGVFSAGMALAGEALRLTADPGLVRFAEWQGHWTWIPPVFVPITLVLLVFPDGRLPSRRWRPVVWCAVVGLVAFTLLTMFGPHLGGAEEYGPNPYHQPLLGRVSAVVATLLLPAVLGGVAAPISRFRRATGVPRQQLKLLAYGGSIAFLVLLATSVVSLTPLVGEHIANLIVIAAVMIVPVAITLAVLRHRLYDIDRLISRTVVYTIVTLCLAAGYAAVVVGLPAWLPIPLNSSVAVALATLVAATLFRPATRWLQDLLDRRFHRSRYDAIRIIETFTVRLRNEIDLGALSVELVEVVDRTVHPATVTLWVPQDGG